MPEHDDPERDIKASGMPDIDPNILARAEQAVAALGDEYIARVTQELGEFRTLIGSSGFETDHEAVRNTFGFAHDMRGQGGSFGFPLLSEIGASLCRFIEARDHQLSPGDTVVFNAHIDAATAVLANGMAEDGGDGAHSLLAGLDALVQKQLGP